MRLILTCLSFIIILSFPTAAQTNSDLVGSYLARFEFGGTEITLNANGTYVSHSSNCTSVVSEKGTYSVANNVLSLNPRKQFFRSFSDNKDRDVTTRKARKKYLDTDEPFSTATEYLQIIRWGERIYLMNENQFEGFVDAINLGFEPREVDGYRAYYGSYLLRVGDETKPVHGPPPFKQELLELLLPAPIIATVLSVEEDYAVIDRGSEDGLRQDMSLVRYDEESFFFDYWLVFEVGPSRSKVRLLRDTKVGDKLTTKVTNPRKFD